jgi:O-acetyl-ADP-ribose deacetylase (regulator of RNase III)
MKIVEGDLIKLALEGKFDVIIHGCNCFGTMSAGIATTIKNTFPEAWQVDFYTRRGDKNKLGKYSFVEIEKNGNQFTVINAYTQYKYGFGKHVDYEAVRKVFQRIKKDFSGKRIGYPLIGAGLGGGDWNIISKIIDEELEGEDHTLVKFK